MIKTLTPEQTARFPEFVKQWINGRYWKTALRQAWQNGSYRCGERNETELRVLRNAGYFGPKGLVKYRVQVQA